MKDLTIAQAQANVEARIRREKRNGARQRKPKQNAMRDMVVAEARRLEIEKARHTIVPSPEHTAALLAEWQHRDGVRISRASAERKRPQGLVPHHSLAEVNRMLLTLQRQAMELQRDCIALLQAVVKLQHNGGKHE